MSALLDNGKAISDEETPIPPEDGVSKEDASPVETISSEATKEKATTGVSNFMKISDLADGRTFDDSSTSDESERSSVFDASVDGDEVPSEQNGQNRVDVLHLPMEMTSVKFIKSTRGLDLWYTQADIKQLMYEAEILGTLYFETQKEHGIALTALYQSCKVPMKRSQ